MTAIGWIGSITHCRMRLNGEWKRCKRAGKAWIKPTASSSNPRLSGATSGPPGESMMRGACRDCRDRALKMVNHPNRTTIENTLFPGRPNYTGPAKGWFGFLHHERVCEESHDVNERIDYVKREKPKNEVPIRLHNMIYLGECAAIAKDAAMHAGYEAKRAALDAGYNAKRAAMRADYEAKRAPLDAGYKAKSAPLYAGYKAKSA